MRYGAKGQAVRIIQQSIIDLGIDPLLKSIEKYDSPDGIFGRETKRAVAKVYQRSKTLVDDGVVGQKTMRAFDIDLPGAGPNLPPLPEVNRYVVPGIVVERIQKKGNLCWASVYAMMISWKKQYFTPEQILINEIGDPWMSLYNLNQSLFKWQLSDFFRTCGLQIIEPNRAFYCFRMGRNASILWSFSHCWS